MIRNATVFRTFLNKMQEQGYIQDQCRKMIKVLKKKHKDVLEHRHSLSLLSLVLQEAVLVGPCLWEHQEEMMRCQDPLTERM